MLSVQCLRTLSALYVCVCVYTCELKLQSYLFFYVRLAIMQNLLVKQLIKYTYPMEGFLYISVLADNKAIIKPGMVLRVISFASESRQSCQHLGGSCVINS